MAVSESLTTFLKTRTQLCYKPIYYAYTKQHFHHFIYVRIHNPIQFIATLFYLANHSSLESQVELTGMLSSREQNPLPIPI